MKARLTLIAAAAVLLGTLAMAPPAEAGHLDWSFGVGFHVSGLHFRIGFSPPGYGGYPGPFFVTTTPLHLPGYGCHGACFRRGAAYYHHASCPLLGFHLHRGGYGPDFYLRSYSPYRGYGPRYAPYPYPYRYRPYPYRPYGHYYRDGHRDRFRPYGGRYYRDRGDRHHRGKGHRGRSYRHDRGRGNDHHSDRGRHYRDDRRGRDGERHRGQPRGGARRTRPPG